MELLGYHELLKNCKQSFDSTPANGPAWDCRHNIIRTPPDAEGYISVYFLYLPFFVFTLLFFSCLSLFYFSQPFPFYFFFFIQ